MHLSDQGLLVILVVGLIAGWLAGKVNGNGFGLSGTWPSGSSAPSSATGFCTASEFISVPGITGLTINATIGAIVLLLALRVTGASGWGGR